MKHLCAPLLLAALLLAGCAANAPDEAPGFSCGVPHCRLDAAPSVRLVEDDGARWLLHEATGARVHVEYVDERATPGRSEAILADWRRRLAPAVNWSQPPQGPGFVVRGVTGEARPPAGVFLVADPTKVWLAAYENPATGSVLLLRAEAPASVWERAWADLGPVVTRVDLAPAF